jgi:hypothetical protein
VIPRDSLLAEIRRAIDAHVPDEAERLAIEIERAIDGTDSDLWCAKDSALPEVLPVVEAALLSSFPQRAAELLALLELASGESRASDFRVFGRKEGPTEELLRRRATAVFEPGVTRIDGHGAWYSVFVRTGWTWPALAVHFYCPATEAGFHPEAILIPETRRVLIGAGQSVLVYALDSPRLLHTESAELGFLHFSRYGDLILMSGELELAAFNLDGTKRWTTFVEPPWSYEVRDGIVHLDVMGNLSRFPLRDGR